MSASQDHANASMSYSSLRRQIKAQVEADMQLITGCVPNQAQYNVNLRSDPADSDNSMDVNDSELAIESNIQVDFEQIPHIPVSDVMNNQSDTFDLKFRTSSSDSSDFDIDSIMDSSPPINELLAKWSIDYNITVSALNGLLSILKPHHPSLPLDSRTLLKTPRTLKVLKLLGGGEYCHSGIANGIREVATRELFPLSSCLDLQFNIDGLPLFKSSELALWPILCLIKQLKVLDPFVVGIYSGTTKPGDVNDFLNEFVSEANILVKEGIVIESKHYKIQIHSFVCDAPARAFIKCVKSHSGYSSCEKCTQRGEYMQKVIFPYTNSSLRSDKDFDEMKDDNHHLSVSPLCVLPVGMVSQFGLDYMHLVCLGVVKRLLLYWKGPVGPRHVRLGRQMAEKLAEKLLRLKSHVPREFARRPRSFSEVPRWKATEFRQFLLYTGPVVLSDILSEAMYNHFLLLSVAITILASPRFSSDYCDYANELLILFVTDAEKLYGKEILVYNVHCLIHLANDVKKLGSLDNFSAFPFENMLGKVKKLVKKPQFPIQQVIRRLKEKEQLSMRSVKDRGDNELKKEHNDGPVLIGYNNARQYKQLQTNDWFFSTNFGDNCFMTVSGCYVLIRNIIFCNDSTSIVCEHFTEVSSAFSYPMSSRNLGICKVTNKMSHFVTVRLSDIARKCSCFPENDTLTSFIVFPLLH